MGKEYISYVTEYMGHKFILRINHSFTYDCENCGIVIFYYQKEFKWLGKEDKSLTLSCNEIFIKKLIEWNLI